YWLAPSNEDFVHAYSLLIEAMRRANRAGIARVVVRNHEYVATVRATEEGVLALDTLLFAGGVRAPGEARGTLPEATSPQRDEYVATVRATEEGVLALDTLLFAEDVRSPGEAMGTLPETTTPQGNEIDMAVQLIDSMSEKWDPEQYHDTHNERVQQLVADKAAG